MLALPGTRPSVGLVAEGNTVVEGTTFTARANRITYEEAKDLLVLEGDGLSYAELFRQLQPGADRSQATARKIYYWRKSQQVKVEGAQGMQINPVPSGSGK
jgi:lipopolysaccharide export system protein LptA